MATRSSTRHIPGGPPITPPYEYLPVPSFKPKPATLLLQQYLQSLPDGTTQD